MTTATYDDAIASLKNFEVELDDDLGFGLKDFFILDESAKDHLFGFVKLGLAAERIRKRKLWQCAKIYKDWGDYCVRSIGKTAWYVNRNIDAANVVMTLIEAGFKVLPTCEAQCRPLVKLVGVGLDAIADVWGKVVSIFSADKITADRVLAIAEPDREVKSQKLPKSVLDRLEREAKKRGMRSTELLEELLGDIEEPIDAEIMAEPDPEMAVVVDRLDRKFKEIDRLAATAEINAEINIVDRSIDAFDRLMDNLIGQFIPRVRLE